MKKILLLLLLAWAVQAPAQHISGRPGRGFGFFAGVESQPLSVSVLPDYSADKPYINFQNGTLGLTLGGLGRFPLFDNLVFQPELGFSYSRLSAKLWADHQLVDQIEYTFADLEMPLHLVLSNPVGRLPLRSSILFGSRLGLNVARPQPTGGIALLRERVGIDLGIGIEFTLGKWRIQPEMLYSHGMNNLHNDTGSRFDSSVDRILRDKVTLRIVVGKREPEEPKAY